MQSTRTCARCHREKTIRGVWYLAKDEQVFVCEACYSGLVTLPALS